MDASSVLLWSVRPQTRLASSYRRNGDPLHQRRHAALHHAPRIAIAVLAGGSGAVARHRNAYNSHVQKLLLRSSFEPQSVSGLPDGLVIFDGECVLCSGWVSFILPRDPQERFRFASIQRMPGRAIAAQLGIDPDAPATNVVVVAGVAYFKSDSALAVLGALDGWRWTRVLRILPSVLRNWVYDRVARNRYKFFGRANSCRVPTADEGARFLDERPYQ